MMSKSAKEVLTSLAISLLLSPWGFPSLPVNAQTRRPAPQPPRPANITQPANTTHPTFERARKELNEDVYAIYRITERIARANGLDQTPWRVVAVQEYDINAFASEINKISLFTGLIDQIAGDSSAIACVIGHEMAHHTERHIAMSESQKAALLQRYEEEAQRQVLAEIQSAQRDATGAALGRRLIETFTRNTTGWGGNAAQQGSNVLSAVEQQRLANAQKRIETIVQQKQLELEKKLAEESRRMEFEADEKGYQYMARAGFDPNGCLRMLGVLARTPGAEFDTTHPAIPRRIERMNELMRQYPPQQLAQEGELRLRGSQPLTYELSRDQQSLRINSRHGGSAARDIEQRFGQ